MKRILLLVLAFTAAIGSLSAQNYIVVNSEKVFKSIDEYNKALDTLDQLAKSSTTTIRRRKCPFRLRHDRPGKT